MQYKAITAAFALFVSATMAMPAAGPADAVAIQARGEEGLLDGALAGVGGVVAGVLGGLGLFDDVVGWKAYTNDDGVQCEPYTAEYDFQFAYKYKYCYTSSDKWDGHLGGSKYPKCKKWLPYKKEGKDCEPYTISYEYEYAYSTGCYESY
ncbi:hypothetical protein CLAFUW4_11126 [Fulvia fulva]|uniref:Uncharacterized protein n=1 Tax=Passalora fulva TaxID=5499 RepID=A0A9Q8PBZ7_PASFU|nr:uncharacterized protein CLAFUR5_10167 [Fulvia fulva]KAK4620160.1 hypothetical protein CLAFUR4_11131 [Fulvia fulva]KAK4620930.1 hypothetical protein CLAFUR0_11137 [Fulvia fulva]UJO19636.1 hypothetical protein CLAFUR5_10167 [Fulvia fulva]WPV17248.1 hypothetical protein CLAFUW4_11126 [Fulvia fulva]WPV32720.1 hypothetical protein CLAFUW7_11122 [Fulvia fulva]